MLNTVFRCLCLLVFGLGLGDALGWAPGRWSAALPLSLAQIAALLLAIHALELIVFQRYLRRYPGPLAVSVLLMLLYGMMHWQPLAEAAKRDDRPA